MRNTGKFLKLYKEVQQKVFHAFIDEFAAYNS